jgi:arsenate reductase-like glutaredoxin family protein
LLSRKAELVERDLGTSPLSEPDLEALIGDRDYTEFLNTRNELYRERKMKQQPPSRAEAIKLMARHPNLIRRPILIQGKRMVVGWDETQAKGLL